MYLTAHRVQSRDRRETGINVFLHHHGGQVVPGMSWDHPDVVLVAEQHPGEVVGESYDLPPGGNSVRSYLDVVASDSTGIEQVTRALDAFRLGLSGVGPIIDVTDGIGIRFGAELGLIGVEGEEFDQLRVRALEVLQASPIAPNAESAPLTIDVTIDDKGFVFSLEAASVERVRQAHEREWQPTKMSIAHETRLDFEAAHGDLIPHVIAVLTGLRLEEVVRMGGASFRNTQTQMTLREWPSKAE